MRLSARSVRVGTVVAAASFLAVALAIRRFTGDGHGDGPWAQYSGTALYASMVYAGVLFLWPRIAAVWAGVIATVFCWTVEAAQLTGVPAALSARSLLARAAFGIQFDWTDMLWYPAGVIPLVAIDRLLLRPGEEAARSTVDLSGSRTGRPVFSGPGGHDDRENLGRRD